jgi:hypothetical protein
MYALSDLHQAKAKPTKIAIEGQYLEAKEFLFQDLPFTADSKVVNQLLELAVTIRVVGAGESRQCVARVQYFAMPRGFTSMYPFDLKFDCLNEKDKPFHSFTFSISLGAKSRRESAEVTFDGAHFQSVHRLRLLPAVQACVRLPGSPSA